MASGPTDPTAAVDHKLCRIGGRAGLDTEENDFNGRGRRFRTLDLRFWRPSLYQLSYTPTRRWGYGRRRKRSRDSRVVLGLSGETATPDLRHVNHEPAHAEDAQEIRSAGQDLCDLRPALHLAEKVGAGLGGGALLLGSLPEGKCAARGWGRSSMTSSLVAAGRRATRRRSRTRSRLVSPAPRA